jgi:uncharacterized protein (DUF2141 family)
VRHRSRPLLALGALIVAPALLGAKGETTAQVQITVTGLRSHQGVVRACMTDDAQHFPRCRDDAASHRVIVRADEPLVLDFGQVSPGHYAIALLHDENDNGTADRAAFMIPKEGYGFSRDARVRMGPPSFEAAAFEVGPAPVRQTIRMRYML